MEKQTCTYKEARDCQLRADVYQASGRPPGPAILFLHGGALILGSREGIRPDQLDRYVNAGYTLISVDYRLAPETKLPAIIEDVQDAFRWVRERGPELFSIDPRRLAVIGHSAGGYLALMAGFCVDPRPSALVSFYGYGDIAGPWYSRPDPFYCRQPAVTPAEAEGAVGDQVIANAAGPEHQNRSRYYLYCRQQGLWPREVMGHDPDMEPDAFDPFCPLRNVTPDYPPTLLLHGDNDTDVPYEQSVLMAEAVARAGVEHQLLTIPGGSHGFDGRMDEPVVSAAFEKVLRFLRQHLGSIGSSEPGAGGCVDA